ncbi:MAG: methylated-DNA--[protein]-cysteine S-methyltransferase [Planctomycetota bacterium]
MTRYAIFKTKWGYFGLAGAESTLCRTCLPGSGRERVAAHLLRGEATARSDNSFFKRLQEQITAYYEGQYVDFDPEIAVSLNGFRTFGVSVLTKCRQLQFGQTITYAGLAERSGSPAASRAVGSTLAKNPMPLIIPCHRVLRTDGGLGGFSAPGGTPVKKKMLELERRGVTPGKMEA